MDYALFSLSSILAGDKIELPIMQNVRPFYYSSRELLCYTLTVLSIEPPYLS